MKCIHLQPEWRMSYVRTGPRGTRVYSRLHTFPLDGKMKPPNIAICRPLGHLKEYVPNGSQSLHCPYVATNLGHAIKEHKTTVHLTYFPQSFKS